MEEKSAWVASSSGLYVTDDGLPEFVLDGVVDVVGFNFYHSEEADCPWIQVLPKQPKQSV